MRLLIVSGLSGSGKSVALNLLEDHDFYCVDNIPSALLKPFVAHTLRNPDRVYARTAVGIDARNTPVEIAAVPALVQELKSSGIDCQLIFLTASDEELLRRYADMAELIQLGAYRQGTDADIDEAILRRPALEALLRQEVDEPWRPGEEFAALARSLGHGVPTQPVA